MGSMQERMRAWVVHGRVQGVGFRYFVVRLGFQLGLRGWTRNLPDGGVEVQARGQERDLDSLEASLRQGPPHAWVQTLDPIEPSQSLESTGSFTIEF